MHPDTRSVAPTAATLRTKIWDSKIPVVEVKLSWWSPEDRFQGEAKNEVISLSPWPTDGRGAEVLKGLYRDECTMRSWDKGVTRPPTAAENRNQTFCSRADAGNPLTGYLVDITKDGKKENVGYANLGYSAPRLPGVTEFSILLGFEHQTCVNYGNTVSVLVGLAQAIHDVGHDQNEPFADKCKVDGKAVDYVVGSTNTTNTDYINALIQHGFKVVSRDPKPDWVNSTLDAKTYLQLDLTQRSSVVKRLA